jgi:membrane protein YqaA with SNARE-associated domain
MALEKLKQTLKQRRWLELALYAVALGAASYGFYVLVSYVRIHFNIPIEQYATTAYLVVFLVTLVSCAGLFIPVYAHIVLMVTVAGAVREVSPWAPLLVALAATTGGTLGEITGYYAGYLGKRIAHVENLPGYQRLAGWMQRHGMLAIFVMSVQPVLPFDVAGLVAGAARVALWKFLVPCWGGRFIKYVATCYLGAAFLNVLPF